MSKTLKLYSLSEYTIRVDLDQLPCELRVYWSEYSDAQKPNFDVDGYWSMDIVSDQFDIKGIKIVSNCELLWPYALQNFGGFYLTDLSEKNNDPDYNGIGDRWELNYIPKDDIARFREQLNLETV